MAKMKLYNTVSGFVLMSESFFMHFKAQLPLILGQESKSSYLKCLKQIL